MSLKYFPSTKYMYNEEEFVIVIVTAKQQKFESIDSVIIPSSILLCYSSCYFYRRQF